MSAGAHEEAVATPQGKGGRGARPAGNARLSRERPFSLLSYMRAHIASLVLCALGLTACYTLTSALGVGRDASVLVVLVCGLCLVCAGLVNWLRERRFVTLVRGVADAGPGKALSMAAELPAPDQAEARDAWEALQAVTSAANRQVSDNLHEMAEYRDYVESWVHEVKTPLAAADLMVGNMDDERLRPLSVQLDRVNNLVEQVLFYARSSTASNDFSVRRTGLDRVVREAVRSRSSQLINAHMGVDMSALAEAPAEVMCDEKWTAFIVGQLLDNAVRYRCTDGSRAPKVSFSTRVLDKGKAAGRVVLDVRDNGCGVSAADIGRVFDRGFTGENGRSRKRSTGFGLYLVDRLCQKTGLAVSIASEEGAWTCVSLVFPVNEMALVDREASL